MKSFWLIFFYLITVPLCAVAQKDPAWDNTKGKHWDSSFSHIKIPSSVDGKLQDVWVYKSTAKNLQPLIISLHTWSGDYNQEDPLAAETVLRNWNYMHPDFRGTNDRPEAGGSPLVVSDIEDAIQYAAKNMNVDTNNIHIIGVSGGGYATLLAYMKLKYPVKSFNAWVPISDLESWYWETKARKLKYADDVEKIITTNGSINWDEAKMRSPFYMNIPAIRKKSILNIYAGVHDGYTGSVPIMQSIHFYNKIVKEIYGNEQNEIVPDTTIISLVTKRVNPNANRDNRIGERIIQLYKKTDAVTLTIFEGGHEMLAEQALALAPIDDEKCEKPYKVLTIGDSNGAFAYGWPNQLKKIMPHSSIINISIPGNTVGFDNNGSSALNTLKNIENYLDSAYHQQSNLDFIIIGLGTNDAKAIFKEEQTTVYENFKRLIDVIKIYHQINDKNLPKILLIAPLPLEGMKLTGDKYVGSNARILKIYKELKRISQTGVATIIDTQTALSSFNNRTNDGVHLTTNAQYQLAKLIVDNLKKLQ